MAQTDPDPVAVIRRLADATNAHDIDAMVACFAPDYRNETPVHPARSFTGREQVRRNWTQILAAVPDVSVEVVASATSGDTVWTEWEHRGTRPDGSPHVMRGVIVFGIRHDLIESARFFLEPVEEGAGGVDDFVRRQVQPKTSA
jgi:ketosteroid isomerase-like protein